MSLYETSWDELKGLPDSPQDYNDRKLFTTWNIGYKRLESNAPSAVQLLHFLAYLDNQDIWYELFHNVVAKHADGSNWIPNWFSDMAQSKIAFNEAMSRLQDQSLIEAKADEGAYGMHVCVHDWTRQRMSVETDRSFYSLAVCCLAASFPPRYDSSDLQFKQRLLPHALRLLYDGIEDVASRLTRQGIECLGVLAELQLIFARSSEDETDAKRRLRGCLALQERVLGRNQEATIVTLQRLGRLCYVQHRNEEDIKLLEQALVRYQTLMNDTDSEREPGPESELWMLPHDLAGAYVRLERLKEAETFIKRDLPRLEERLGPNHIITNLTIGVRGQLYLKENKLKEAQADLGKARHLFEKREQEGTFDSFGSFLTYDLSMVYEKQGNVVEAETMLGRVLKSTQHHCGKNSIPSLYICGLLADYLRRYNRLDDAEALLEGSLSEFDEDDVKTFVAVDILYNAYNVLGLVYLGQGKLRKAEKVLESAIHELSEFQRKGPVLTYCIYHLSFVYKKQGRLEEAESFLAGRLDWDEVNRDCGDSYTRECKQAIIQLQKQVRVALERQHTQQVRNESDHHIAQQADQH